MVPAARMLAFTPEDRSPVVHSPCHSPLTLRRALNAQLPKDIRVLRVQEVDEQFHARFSARGKEYRYQIDCGPVADPFLRDTHGIIRIR